MILCAENKFSYEAENVVRLFLPQEKIEKTAEAGIPQADEYIYTSAEVSNENTRVFVRVSFRNKELSGFSDTGKTDDKSAEIAIATLIYKFLSQICGFSPKWGILTGVRPAKLFSARCRTLGSQSAAERYFADTLLVDKSKISLARDTVDAEKKALGMQSPDSMSLYVSVPFCPTRCSYCSFVSHSVEKTAALVEPYTQLLIKEIEYTAEVAKRNGLKLKTVYFGGGTPTQLSANQLCRVTDAVRECFDMSGVFEYTVEAGRPDTVDGEKLAVLKEHGVTRISINPQTMEDSVLRAIGRKHSVQCIRDAFSLARSMGFDFINADLIAGLPTDTLDGFKASLEEVISLSPENITVHTLSLKRSSRLVTDEGGIAAEEKAWSTVEKMLGCASEQLYSSGYSPYYLYRQSKMLGNQENVGWAKKNRECYYNIYMMNELHTVLSVGASAVTRLKAPHSEKIERIFNFKYPYEYISRFDELIGRKKKVDEFYEKYRI